MMLNSVDFPHPDGPMTDTNSPSPTSSETPSTASSASAPSPKRLTMSVTASIGAPGAGEPVPARVTVTPTGERMRSPGPCTSSASVAHSARRDLHELGQLLFGERRCGELERDGVLDDRIEADDLVGVDRRFRKEVVTRPLRLRFGDADEFGVHL